MQEESAMNGLPKLALLAAGAVIVFAFLGDYHGGSGNCRLLSWLDMFLSVATPTITPIAVWGYYRVVFSCSDASGLLDSVTVEAMDGILYVVYPDRVDVRFASVFFPAAV